MKSLFLSLLAFLSLSSLLQAQESAEALFESKCLTCHIKYRPEDKSSLVAPPMVGAMKHVMMVYPSKEQAVAFITDYVMNPSKDKAVCKKGKIRHFGLMPSQKESLSEVELKSIAVWMVEKFSLSKKGRNCAN